MQYALVNGVKSEPVKGTIGKCLGCGNTVLAKCGNIKLHHWAHKNLIQCDSWAENETEWHRDWKNKFPINSREILFKDDISKEYHRADVHTINNITFEFQNSPISTAELKSRDIFYKKLIWVVNAKKFRGQFELTSIPSPTNKQLSKYDFSNGKAVVFTKIISSGSKTNLVEVFSLQSQELKHIKVSPKHFHFTWKHKHIVWYSSSSEVFLDFGDAALYWLRKRKQTSCDYWYFQIISKREFLNKYSDLENLS